jgi:hypothetical protein
MNELNDKLENKISQQSKVQDEKALENRRMVQRIKKLENEKKLLEASMVTELGKKDEVIKQLQAKENEARMI